MYTINPRAFFAATPKFARLVCAGLISAMGVLACQQSHLPQPAKDVDYYRLHALERRTRVSECARDPGNLSDTPDCVNAQRAEELEGIGHLKSLPPMEMRRLIPGTTPLAVEGR